MATEITMPKLSDTMTDGRFIGWRKSVGERVERGDVIAEVETDKAVMELEAFASGVLLRTMATGGETVPVGTVLGLIGEPGEALPEEAAAPAKPEETAPPSAPEPSAPPEVPVQEAAAAPDEGHEKASPLVRRMARELGIDLALVHGSGPEGRVLQEDLTTFAAAPGAGAAVAAPPAAEEPAAVAAGVPPLPEGAPPSPMRQAISATVTRSWREIPHFTVTVEIGMEACAEIVRELKGSADAVGYSDLVLKACAVALMRFPRLNAPPTGGAEAGVHIGFAVALPDGLLVPVVRECERLSAREIAREASQLAERARAGRLTREEMSGGGFTVSNLGMYGVDEFMALIMPGQAAILAVGAVTDRPAVRGGQLAVLPAMRVTLSADHRIVDGAYAAGFLAELRRILEQPLPLLL